MVKFNFQINRFDYIMSFDLAKFKTGWSLLDFRKKEIIATGTIDSSKQTDEERWYYLLQEFARIYERFAVLGPRTFITKERLPNQAGFHSTIFTLQELAKVHAIFELSYTMYAKGRGYNIYDLEGVHSISVKSYYKKITGLDKPTKTDIQTAVCATYNYNLTSEDHVFLMTEDISDSMAVVETLINYKWDADLKAEIASRNKEIRSAKSEKKKQQLLLQAELLCTLYIIPPRPKTKKENKETKK